MGSESVLTKLRISAARLPLPEPPDPLEPPPHNRLQPPSQFLRWVPGGEIGPRSRSDTTVQACRFAVLWVPTTICQMDRSDSIASFPLAPSEKVKAPSFQTGSETRGESP